MPTDGNDSTLFVNVTGKNMMDYVNYRRFEVIKTKSDTIRTANFETVGGTYLHKLGVGQVDATTVNTRYAPMINIVRFRV